MKKQFFIAFTLKIFIILLVASCTKDSINENTKNVFDCELGENSDFIGICLKGAEFVNPDEELKYASKSNSIFSEIQWEIESGNIEILNIDNSIQGDFYKSIATIKFNADFTGGSLNVKAIDSNGNYFAEVTNYVIELQN